MCTCTCKYMYKKYQSHIWSKFMNDHSESYLQQQSVCSCECVASALYDKNLTFVLLLMWQASDLTAS